MELTENQFINYNLLCCHKTHETHSLWFIICVIDYYPYLIDVDEFQDYAI